MRRRDERQLRNRHINIGASCFLAGVGLALVGAFFITFATIAGAQLHPVIALLGNFFLLTMIPLLVVSGCCMDRSDRHR